MNELRRISTTAEITPSVPLARPKPKRPSTATGTQARLHRRNRTDILCSRPTCRGKLAALRLEDELIAEWHPQGWATVVVPSGFVPYKDGIWRRSKRARSRRPERGQRVQQRRRAYMSWNGAAGSTSLDESMNRALPLGDRQAVAPPFRIECPECGFVSMVSWEGLDLLSTE